MKKFNWKKLGQMLLLDYILYSIIIYIWGFIAIVLWSLAFMYMMVIGELKSHQQDLRDFICNLQEVDYEWYKEQRPNILKHFKRERWFI